MRLKILHFRSTPEIGANVIKVLKRGTKIVVLDYAGYSSGYFWLKVQV
jgi:hypothetical protein